MVDPTDAAAGTVDGVSRHRRTRTASLQLSAVIFRRSSIGQVPSASSMAFRDSGKVLSVWG